MYSMILGDLSHQSTFLSDVKRAAQSNIVAPGLLSGVIAKE